MLALLWLFSAGLVLAVSAHVAVGRSTAVPAESPLQAAATALGGRQMTDVDVDTGLTGQQRTIMQCLGTQTLTRACHFENVYYELSSSRFVHYGVAGATPDIFGDDLRPKHPWLRMVRGFRDWRRGYGDADTQFFMDWRPGEPLPPADEVVAYDQPLHLRSPFNTKSLGHLLRDNLQWLVDLPLRFGRDPAAFDWVRWHSKMKWSDDWETESPTAQHYRGLVNNRPSLTWQEVLDQALSGRDPASAGVRYIRFAELIAGQGPADIYSQVGSLWGDISTLKLSAWAHMCDPFSFTAMRHIAYRNFGLTVASVHELEPFVLFLDGQPGEKRHLVNAPELLPRLKETFPGVRMEHVEISAHPLEEQLQLLAKATVLVSNVGSRSFRLIYLPNGATTILVGPPEFEFQLVPTDPNKMADNMKLFFTAVNETTPFTLEKPFLEIDWCWGYIGYVNMLRYHVATAAEVDGPSQWTDPQEARNTDVLLNEEKITDLLRVALARAQHSTAQRGSGDLSALALDW